MGEFVVNEGICGGVGEEVGEEAHECGVVEEGDAGSAFEVAGAFDYFFLEDELFGSAVFVWDSGWSGGHFWQIKFVWEINWWDCLDEVE